MTSEVQFVSTKEINISHSTNGNDLVTDSVEFIGAKVKDLILVKDQSQINQNGVYKVVSLDPFLLTSGLNLCQLPPLYQITDGKSFWSVNKVPGQGFIFEEIKARSPEDFNMSVDQSLSALHAKIDNLLSVFNNPTTNGFSSSPSTSRVGSVKRGVITYEGNTNPGAAFASLSLELANVKQSLTDLGTLLQSKIGNIDSQTNSQQLAIDSLKKKVDEAINAFASSGNSSSQIEFLSAQLASMTSKVNDVTSSMDEIHSKIEEVKVNNESVCLKNSNLKKDLTQYGENVEYILETLTNITTNLTEVKQGVVDNKMLSDSLTTRMDNFEAAKTMDSQAQMFTDLIDIKTKVDTIEVSQASSSNYIVNIEKQLEQCQKRLDDQNELISNQSNILAQNQASLAEQADAVYNNSLYINDNKNRDDTQASEILAVKSLVENQSLETKGLIDAQALEISALKVLTENLVESVFSNKNAIVNIQEKINSESLINRDSIMALNESLAELGRQLATFVPVINDNSQNISDLTLRVNNFESTNGTVAQQLGFLTSFTSNLTAAINNSPLSAPSSPSPNKILPIKTIAPVSLERFAPSSSSPSVYNGPSGDTFLM